MKKKEREHLKQDPFQQFIEKTVDTLQKYKREIFIGLGVLAGIAVIIVGILLYNVYSAKVENKLFSQALSIKSDGSLTIDQKIGKLSKLDSKSGISSSVKLFLAALYFEKGDVDKSGKELEKFPSSKIKILNEQKSLLEADILCASNKHKEALVILNNLYSDPKLESGKDFILLKMAKIQVKTKQLDMAKTNLNKIVEDYPQTQNSYEARQILDDLDQTANNAEAVK